MVAQITCHKCKIALSLPSNIGRDAKVKCPKCGVALAVPIKKILSPPVAHPVAPAGETRPISSGSRFVAYSLPTGAVLVAFASLAIPILNGQYLLGLILACLAALVSVAGLVLLAFNKWKGATVNVVGVAICATAVFVCVHAHMLKDNIEKNETLLAKNELAVSQAKADLDESKKKLAEAADAPRKAEEILKKAEEAPKKAQAILQTAKDAQDKADASEKKTADLLAEVQERESKLDMDRKKIMADRAKVTQAEKDLKTLQKKLDEMQKGFDGKKEELATLKNEIDADKKKAEDDLASLKKEIEVDRKKAEEKQKEAKDLLKKVEGVLKGAALQLQDKNPQVRLKTAKQIGKLSDVPNAKEILGESLCQAMFDPLPEVRNAASESLELLDPRVHPHIVTLMIGKDKSNAAVALGTLKGDAKSAIPVLIATHQRFLAELQEKGRALNSFSCVDVLTKVAPEDQRVVQIVLAGITDTISRIPMGMGKKGAAPGLRRQSNPTRMDSLAVLDRLTISDKEKTSVLVMALSDGQDAIAVLAEIGKIGPGASDAIPALNALRTGSPNDQMRAAATAALARIQSKDQPEQKKKGKGL